MASRLADTDGLHIYGWMRNQLKLSSGELVTFAIVFRSSQSKTGIYTGGIPYVAEFVGCSKETARKYLHQLEAKGLIEGTDVDKGGVRHRNYQVVDTHIPKNLGYIPKNLGGDTQNSLVGVPKKFGLEEYSSKNNQSNIPPFPPTVKEVADYCRTQGFADPDGFADYYVRYQTENGWMTGKGANRKPIDNWKLNVIAWGRYRKNETFAPATPVNPETKDMSIDEFNSIFR